MIRAATSSCRSSGKVGAVTAPPAAMARGKAALQLRRVHEPSPAPTPPAANSAAAKTRRNLAGAFGSVMLAKDTLTGELVAIKRVVRGPDCARPRTHLPGGAVAQRDAGLSRALRRFGHCRGPNQRRRAAGASLPRRPPSNTPRRSSHRLCPCHPASLPWLARASAPKDRRQPATPPTSPQTNPATPVSPHHPRKPPPPSAPPWAPPTRRPCARSLAGPAPLPPIPPRPAAPLPAPSRPAHLPPAPPRPLPRARSGSS